MKYIKYFCFSILSLFVHQANAYTLCTSNPAGSTWIYCVSISGPGIPDTEEIKTRDDATYLTVKQGEFSIAADSRGYVCDQGGCEWRVRRSGAVWVNGAETKSGTINLAPAAEYQIRHMDGGATIYVKIESEYEGGYWFNANNELTEWYCGSNGQPSGDGWGQVSVTPSCFHRLVTSYFYDTVSSQYIHWQCGVYPTGKGWSWQQDGCYQRVVKDFY